MRILSRALEVAGAVATRFEDVVGEWLDTRHARPAPTISHDVRERIVAEVVEAIEMYLDARFERRQVWVDDADLFAACVAACDPKYLMSGEWKEREPIAALIKKRDNMVVACRITLSGRLANLVDGITGARL